MRSIKKWCLGFVFSLDLQHVILMRKRSKYLHVVLWNGVGGALENEDLGSSMNAMVRECREDTGINIPLVRWIRIGRLNGPIRDWEVDVFATRTMNHHVRPRVLWPDIESILENPGRLNSDYYDVDRAVMMPIQVLHLLKMAPHGAALTLAALERLKDDTTPYLKFTQLENV